MSLLVGVPVVLHFREIFFLGVSYELNAILSKQTTASL